jgi:hypothetical protein
MAIWNRTKNKYERNPKITEDAAYRQLVRSNEYWVREYRLLIEAGADIERVELTGDAMKDGAHCNAVVQLYRYNRERYLLNTERRLVVMEDNPFAEPLADEAELQKQEIGEQTAWLYGDADLGTRFIISGGEALELDTPRKGGNGDDNEIPF